MIMEQRYLPSSTGTDMDSPSINIPTFITPDKADDKEDAGTPSDQPSISFDGKESSESNPIQRRGSGSFAFCLPMTFAGDNDDPYELMNSSNDGTFLSVNDRLVSFSRDFCTTSVLTLTFLRIREE